MLKIQNELGLQRFGFSLLFGFGSLFVSGFDIRISDVV